MTNAEGPLTGLRVVELGWVTRTERRVVRVNASGRAALPEQLGVDSEALG